MGHVITLTLSAYVAFGSQGRIVQISWWHDKNFNLAVWLQETSKVHLVTYLLKTFFQLCMHFADSKHLGHVEM